MKAPNPSFSRGLALVVALAATACQGEILEPADDSSAPSDSEVDPLGGRGGGPIGQGGAAGRSPSAAAGRDATSGSPGEPGGGEPDVNRVPIHRLNNTEYDNTMRDLLGVESKAGSAFIDDEKLLGFDNIAAAFGMSDARYEQYFNAADALVEAAFADQGARRTILVCAPASASDADCARRVLEPFALRALRRPATDSEIDRLLAVFDEATELGEDFAGGIKNALKALLSSAAFLYRIELDPDPTSARARRLNGYELGSRLSYLLWSTMPDAALFESAESGALLSDDGLVAELERLIADGKSRQFIENFGGQWLGLRALQSHQVDTAEYPAWNEPLRAAMVGEGLLYFTEFFRGERPMSEFFTADVNFVNAALAELYGFSRRSGDELVAVTNTSDERRGFLGLASFLTRTSFSKRTAPTLRGMWVLENLLCTEVPPPPGAVPELETGSGASGEPSDNVRERLEAHRSNPGCAGCHQILDPIGLGLESFDAIGRYREAYASGDAVDAAGELPSGEKFNGLLELSSILANDERLADCTVEKMMTYALAREIVASDAASVESVKDAWIGDGMGLASLLKHIVLNESFRSRRGEP